MNEVKIKIRFSGYYNDKQQSFDGGIVKFL